MGRRAGGAACPADLIDAHGVLSEPSDPPVLEVGLRQPDLTFEMILTSRGGFDYAIEATEEFSQWTRIGTLSKVNGSVQFLDTEVVLHPHRFYRGLMVQ